MDRLHTIISLSLVVLLGACEAAPPGAAPPSRVVAVAAKAQAAPDDALAGFCDVSGEQAQAHTFTVPETHGEAGATAGKRWVNIWASWCKPCLEEMPRLVQWKSQLAKDGADIGLRFVSADNDEPTFEAFMKEHPNLPPSELLKDPTTLTGWLSDLGLDPGAGLPVHAFLDGPTLRCVRAGAVTDNHYEIVGRVFTR